MTRCLYPDCDFDPEHSKGMKPEQLKRLTIAHINTTHPDAQVLIACECELVVDEEIDEQRTGPEGTFRDHIVVSRCVRCGDMTRLTMTEVVPGEEHHG